MKRSSHNVGQDVTSSSAGFQHNNMDTSQNTQSQTAVVIVEEPKNLENVKSSPLC